MPDINLLSYILLFPLISFIICQILGRKFQNISGYIFCLFTIITFLLSFLLFKNNQQITSKSLSYSWFSIAKYNFNFSVLLDNYTYKMLLLINFISFLVGLFSIKYMEKDEAKSRYFGFISLFIFAMEGIVISGNLFQMYFFWEMVGFCSYLLIGFWYKKSEAIIAAKKAFIINRIGDICLLFGIFMLFYYQGNSQIESLKLGLKINENQTLIGLLLFGGCVAKSAQFPLHTWLPDAMEGPTPVSALIHAATMVAAGIYLIIRIFPIFTENALMVIAIIGCISMLMGGTKAIFQSDIKKVLAYSTISQLGLMVLAVGGRQPDFAFNHLLTHAFFKAGLFLGAGSVIYAVHKANPIIDAQNMLTMGGFRSKMPITFFAFLSCSAAMIGLPFFTGFITKDLIIETWQHKAGLFANLIFISLLISTLLSAVYMGRQIWLVFLKSPASENATKENLSESPWQIIVPITILAAFSTFIIIPLLEIDWPAINSTAILSTGVALIGLLFVHFQKQKLVTLKFESKIDKFYHKLFVNNNLYLAEKINYFDIKIFDGITKVITSFSISISKIMSWSDTNLVDGSVSFLVKLTGFIGKRFNKLQSGAIQWYFSAIVILIFVIYLFL